MIGAELSILVPRWLVPLADLPRLERTYSAVRAMDQHLSFCERLLKHLRIQCPVSEHDLAHVPRTGAAVVAANHPFGLLDGAVLAAVLERVRPDVRLLANGVLASIPELRHRVIPVDPQGGASGNHRVIRQALAHLEAGGLLIVFPAGEVAHFQWRKASVADSTWNPAVARIIELAARGGQPVSILPAFVGGRNSLAFQAAGVVHPRLRTALLGRELLNKRGHVVDLRIGSPINSARLLALPDAGAQCAYLRGRCELLARRQPFKPLTSRPLPRIRSGHAPTIAPVTTALLRNDVARLADSQCLGRSGELAVYLAEASQIPNVLREIGRLREVTFRLAGEGTGKPSDLDRFDGHYQHLFLWNDCAGEIAGAYRLCPASAGASRLYTAELFGYGDAFLQRLGPAVELGRSFVRAEYQRGFAPLLLLWKGIGKFIARHPQCKTLFGPVSISNRYQAISRELMVAFLERSAWMRGWANLIAPRRPFRKRGGELPACLDVDDLSSAVSDVEPDRAGVPVLLRQYLRLGGKLLGFQVDPGFSNVLDGLILVDLTQTEPKLVERYLGKAEAARFFAFHQTH